MTESTEPGTGTPAEPPTPPPATEQAPSSPAPPPTPHDPFLTVKKNLPTGFIILGAAMILVGVVYEVQEQSRRDAERSAQAERMAALREANKPKRGRRNTTDLRDALSHLSFSNEDPHTCDKTDDAYYAKVGWKLWGAERPNEALRRGNEPEFLFNTRHDDDTINWANGFKGKVPVCFVIDEKGMVTDIKFPQPPDDAIQQKLKERMSGWRYKPGEVLVGHIKHPEPQIVKSQVAVQFKFQ